MGLVILILLIALVLGVLGVVVEGLLWLLGVVLALVIGAAVIGWARGRGHRAAA